MTGRAFDFSVYSVPHWSPQQVLMGKMAVLSGQVTAGLSSHHVSVSVFFRQRTKAATEMGTFHQNVPTSTTKTTIHKTLSKDWRLIHCPHKGIDIYCSDRQTHTHTHTHTHAHMHTHAHTHEHVCICTHTYA